MGFNYHEYVEEQIELFKKYSQLYDESTVEISHIEINNAMVYYSSINAMLNAEYQRKKKESKSAKDEFQQWYDSKYIETKLELESDRPKSYNVPKNEVEANVRVKYAKENKAYQSLITDLDLAVSFLRRLMDQWKQHGQILMTLSQNMRQEMKSFTFENVVNNAEKPAKDVNSRVVRRREVKR